MRIELTATGPAGSRDLAIEAAATTPFVVVAPAVIDAVGGRAGATLWHGAERVPTAGALFDVELRTGATVGVGRPERPPQRPGVLSLHVVGGPGAGRIVPIERGTLTIGRSPTCDLVLADDGASREHAALTVSGQVITVHDFGSTNGTLVDGSPIDRDGVAIGPGELIRIGDTLLSVAGPDDAPAAVTASESGALVNRAPRATAPIDDREVELPERVVSARPRGVQWVTALLPALAGGAIAWLSRSPQFLLFALLSPVMLLSGALGDRLHWRRSRRRDARSYRRRHAAAQTEIAAGLAAEAVQRRRAGPDPAAVWRIATTPTVRLWERRRGDHDFLHVRLGSATMHSTLRVRTGATSGSAGPVADVPVGVDLRSGPLGLAGPADAVPGLADWVATQLAALHSPADVEIAFLLADDAVRSWHWSRWLPQLRGRVATTADERQALISEVAGLVRGRDSGVRQHAGRWAGPWTVLVVDRAAELSDLPGLAGILTDGPRVGVTAVCVSTDEQGLPTACAAVASIGGDGGTRVHIRRPDGDADDAVVDRVDPGWAEGVARALAPLIDASAEADSAVPESCSLTAVLGLGRPDPGALAARWAGSTGRADTILGLGVDGPVRVDLGVDGPHALIAGTTGAGKSELLQSLVAGLAADHPPDEIAFLLIDYKGGAAFAECAGLPHTAGLVTDLDPHLTRRALQSLDAELRRRERIFAAAGVADLDAYRLAAGPEPLPRLLIVVDEFAALVEELPDFVRGLVAVAQRGRSLGIHLVLATQRPGTAVSADIRANTGLRIALRVTDPAESQDVIDTGAAAGISRSYPGRGYLRAGPRLEAFQTARASGRAPTDRPRVEVLGDWRRRPLGADTDEGSDLADLVEAARVAAERAGRGRARSPWLAPLPTTLPTSDLEPVTATAIPVGAVDLPADQARATLRVGLDPGSTALVVGTARCGRTGFLVTAALGAATARSPAQLQIHVIDATGVLTDVVGALPHVGTCLAPADLDLAPILLSRLAREVATRVAARSTTPVADPAVLLVIDGWDALLTRLDDATAAHCGDQLAAVIRAGTAVGLSVLVTGDRGLLAPRFAGLFAERIALRLSDRGDYAMVGIAGRDVPATLPPGRGIRARDGAEVQLAHVGSTAGAADQRRVAAETARRWRSHGAATGVIRIRPLPDRVELATLPSVQGRVVLGVGGDGAELLAIDPFAGSGRLLVAGPPRSGRSTLLASILEQAHRAGLDAVVAATARSPLAARARRCQARVIDPDEDPDLVGPAPSHRVLLLVDDSERFVDSGAGDRLTGWVRSARSPVATVVAGRTDDLATCYRGVGAEVRRSRCGLLLRPGPLDGELLGVRLPRGPSAGPPGRGVLVGEPAWGDRFTDGEPVPVQVAQP